MMLSFFGGVWVGLMAQEASRVSEPLLKVRRVMVISFLVDQHARSTWRIPFHVNRIIA
jgi:hypothetical protein